MKIPIKLLTKTASIPKRGSDGAAGYDLFAAEECCVYAGERRAISTQVAVSIPRGHYGRIAPRSGLAARNGIDVLGGVIDSDYRGELKVILFNSGNDDLLVAPGHRIAQLIIERCFDAEFEQFDDLDQTKRGEGGFGSTGIKREMEAA